MSFCCPALAPRCGGGLIAVWIALLVLPPGLALAGVDPVEDYEAARSLQVTALRKGKPADWQKAADAFEDFVKQHESHRLVFEARFGLAECLLAAGDAEQSWKVYRELRETEPDRRVADLVSGEAYVLLAMMESSGDPELEEMFHQRVADLREADSRHDRLLSLIIASAHLHRQAGRREEAVEALMLVVASWPDDPAAEDVWDDLGALRFEMEAWEDAIRAYRGYLRNFPGGERANDIRCLTAYVYLQQGKTGDTISASESLLERLKPKRNAADARLWTETVKILAVAQAPEVGDLDELFARLGTGARPWSLDVAMAILGAKAADGEAQLALDGLERMKEQDLLDLDKATDTLREQLVGCCMALRDVRPDDEEVQRWLLVAALQLDELDRSSEASSLLQWVRTQTRNPSIRREARELQLRTD